MRTSVASEVCYRSFRHMSAVLSNGERGLIYASKSRPKLFRTIRLLKPFLLFASNDYVIFCEIKTSSGCVDAMGISIRPSTFIILLPSSAMSALKQTYVTYILINHISRWNCSTNKTKKPKTFLENMLS